MFSRASTAVLAFFVAVAIAGPVARTDGCSRADVQCCNTNQAGGILSNDCVSFLTLLKNGQTCTGQTACCSKENITGIINVVCSPVNVVL